ncbi:MAG TPA: phospholipid carrier-dependent glycosyltransferase [Fimbriimonadaceae bacterium]|nr:phospholipid carrier-dependent glycosyltransferase [Fimbriimonadaceae bacterium]
MPDSANSSTLDRRILIAAIVLALLHAGLALWFASFTPYRSEGLVGRRPAPDIGAPDERAHANYIQGLLKGSGIPVLDLDKMQSDKVYRAEQYENHQPPLYYLAAAGWGKLTGVADVAEQSAGLRLRALNAVFGAATVLAVFFGAWWGFRRPDLAVASALFPALLPMNVALSGAISNDPLLFALMTWAMAVTALALRAGWSLKSALLVGVLTGLAILTKTTGIALLPVLLLAVLIRQAKRPTPIMVAAAVLGVVVFAGPWLVRNQSVYHDPLATNVFNKAFADNPHKESIETLPGGEGLGYWTNWVGWWTARSFIGVFGYMDIFLNESGTPKTESGTDPNTLYRACLAVLAVVALGWVLSLGEPWAKQGGAVTCVNALLVLVVVFLFWRFNNVFFQGQARYLYPAIGPISIGFGSGLLAWGRKRPSIAIGAAATLLLALVIYAGIRVPNEFGRRSPSVSTGNDLPRGGVQ